MVNSDQLFAILSRFINFPKNVVSVNINLELQEPVKIDISYYLGDIGKSHICKKRFNLVECDIEYAIWKTPYLRILEEA